MAVAQIWGLRTTLLSLLTLNHPTIGSQEARLSSRSASQTRPQALVGLACHNCLCTVSARCLKIGAPEILTWNSWNPLVKGTETSKLEDFASNSTIVQIVSYTHTPLALYSQVCLQSGDSCIIDVQYNPIPSGVIYSLFVQQEKAYETAY